MGTLPPDIAELIGDLPARTDVVQFQDSAMSGAYDGASRFQREVAMWHPSMRSADGDVLADKILADTRTRDMVRNDAFVASGVNIHKDSIVGAFYMLNSKPNWKALGLGEAWATEFQEEVESKFTLWAESPRCWPDASKMLPFTGMVRLAIGMYTMTGEILATAEWRRDNSRNFSTCVQLIDPDRLSNPDGQMDTPELRGGVKRDWMGAPVGYYIRMAHPSDLNDINTYRWKYVPATKGLASGRPEWDRPMVIHIVDQFRPEQSRGIAAMVSALKEMRMTKHFRDVTLQKAVTQATYAATIESDLPSEAVYQALGGGGHSANGVTEWAAKYLGAIAGYTAGAKNLQLDGVKIPHLFPGTKLNLQNAGAPEGVGSDFEKSLLRYTAAALGVSYEQLSRDYSEANYSSVRAAMNETHRSMQAKKRLGADRFASMVYRLWLEEAINKGEINLPKRAPNWYEGLNADAYSACEWIGASRGQVDELKETQAAVLRLKYNLSTHEEEMARLGKDWRQCFAQREREKKDMEARGLQVEESNAINAASGAPRESEGPE